MADDGGFGAGGWLSGAVALLGGSAGLGGLWAWLTARDKTRAERERTKVDLVGIAQKAAHDQIVDLRDDVDRARDDATEARREADHLRTRVSTLEEQHLALSRDHRALMLANETLQATNDDLRRTNQRQVAEIDRLAAENIQLTGELRQAKQVIESMGVVGDKAGGKL